MIKVSVLSLERWLGSFSVVAVVDSLWLFLVAKSSQVSMSGFKKTRVFKKAQPSGFFGFYWVFWTSRKK